MAGLREGRRPVASLRAAVQALSTTCRPGRAPRRHRLGRGALRTGPSRARCTPARARNGPSSGGAGATVPAAPQGTAASLAMKPAASSMPPPAAAPGKNMEVLWEGYVSKLTGIVMRHLPDLWHVLHVRARARRPPQPPRTLSLGRRAAPGLSVPRMPWTRCGGP